MEGNLQAGFCQESAWFERFGEDSIFIRGRQ